MRKVKEKSRYVIENYAMKGKEKKKLLRVNECRNKKQERRKATTKRMVDFNHGKTGGREEKREET